MRQILLPIMTVLTMLLLSNGCSDETEIQGNDPRASVAFDFWAGARNVEVDGEIFNDGNTYIEHIEIEILLYDEVGQYINSAYQSFAVDLRPQDSFIFTSDLHEYEIYDVDVLITTFW
jgi:hypothetical protein